MTAEDRRASRHLCQGFHLRQGYDVRRRRARGQTSLTGRQLQTKARIELPAIVFSTTGQTGRDAPDPSHPREIAPAIRALVLITPATALHGEGESVATPFVCDSQIAAGLPPERAVRRDAPPAGPELREQVRQFMPESPVDFRRPMLVQSRIERNERPCRVGPAGAGAETRIPFHPDLVGQSGSIPLAQEFARGRFTIMIPSRRPGRGNCGEAVATSRFDFLRIESELELLR